MKKTLFLAALLPQILFAHSQDTTEQNKLPYFKNETVEITVRNLNDFPQSYEIVVRNYDKNGRADDRTLGRTEEFQPGESKELDVRLSGISAGSKKEVCSRSIPKEGQMFSTLICTTFNFDWSFLNEDQ